MAARNSQDNPQKKISIHEAVMDGNKDMVGYLIANGSDVNMKNWYGNSPLHVAVSCGRVEILKFLIENGASVDAKDKYGDTPLHDSAQLGHVEVSKCLIENGANVTEKNEDGCTPLHDAAGYGHVEVLKYLIENGANVTEKNEDGETPDDLATKYGHQDVVNYFTEIMMEKKKAENEKIPEENYSNKDPCSICVEPKNGIFAFFPCGHSLLCEPCCIRVQRLNSKCPLCRMPITAYKKIFIQ